MVFNHLMNAVVLGVFMSFMIGPVFFKLIQISILKGVKAAIFFNVGVVLCDITFILIAYFSSKSFLEKIKDDLNLFLIGGLAMIIYGCISYSKASKNKDIPEFGFIFKFKNMPEYLNFFLQGFFLNFINIGVLAFWISTILLVNTSLNMDGSLIFTYFSTVLLTYFLLDFFKIFLAKKLNFKLTPTLILKINKCVAYLFVFFGFFLIFKILHENYFTFF